MANFLFLDYFDDIRTIYINPPKNPGVTIFCDDNFMIRSTTEFEGGPIPQGYDHAYYC